MKTDLTAEAAKIPISGFPAWAAEHWVLLTVIAVALLVIFFVLIPLFFKLIRRQKKMVETTELKKDLMVWRNLSSLVQGGDKENSAKQNLSGQMHMIRTLFKQGEQMARSSGRKISELPGFILLGEPMSGKSSLIRNSEMEFACSAAEDSDDPAKHLPIRFWVGAQAYVLDVAGRVFFDRWLEGSSAEWTAISKYICRFRRKRPLDGILVTIPADALLSDNEALVKQKATLITTELQQLLTYIGMYVPCHVIITKADMILGFREYFSDLGDDFRTQVFGWRSQTPDGRYDHESMNAAWQETLKKLREGRNKLYASKRVFNSDGDRFDLTSKIYLFPENFNLIFKNLDLYLKTIFGKDNWLGNDRGLFSGVYVTAAEDSGVSICPDFAELCSKNSDEAVVPAVGSPLKQPYFIRTLLHKRIFADTDNAFFCSAELFKRNLFRYFLCALIGSLGVFWLLSPILHKHQLKQNLAAATDYYKKLTGIIERNGILSSPLIAKNKAGRFLLMNDMLMEGAPEYSRLQFFYNARFMASQNFYVPAGYRAAAHFTLSDNKLTLNLGKKSREKIFNTIQVQMVSEPVIKAMQNRLLHNGNEKFTLLKREAFFDYIEISFTTNPEYFRKMNIKLAPIDAHLAYLYPELTIDTITLFSSYFPKSSTQQNFSSLVYDYGFGEAMNAAIRQFTESWKKLEIYPETAYPSIRALIRAGNNFNDNLEKILNFTTGPRAADSLDSLRKLLNQQKILAGNIDESLENIRKNIPEIVGTLKNTSKEEEKNDGGKNAAAKKNSDGQTDSDKSIVGARTRNLNLFKDCVADYQRRLDKDEQEIRREFDYYEQFLHGRSNASFSLNKKELIQKIESVRDSLKRESEGLAKKTARLKQSGLFDFPVIERKDEKAKQASEFNYQILERLCQFAWNFPEVKPLSNIQDFETAWLASETAIEQLDGAFEAYVADYAKIPELTSKIQAFRKLLHLQVQRNRYILVSSLINVYPASASDFSAMVGKESKGGELFKISPVLAAESIGKFSYQTNMDPKVAEQLLRPFENIASVLERPDGAKKTGKPASISAFSVSSTIPKYSETKKMIGDYYADYISYWTGFADSLRRKPKNWNEFRTFCLLSKSYQVNNLLLRLYKGSEQVFASVNDKLLPPELLKKKKAAELLLANRIQMIEPNFTETCYRLLTNWGALPSNPVEAFGKLNQLSAKEISQNYAAVYAPGMKGDIPWWTEFLKLGAELLKKEASASIVDSLKQSETELLTFPLCADSLSRNVLSYDELKEQLARLALMGLPSTGKKVPAENGKKEKAPLPGETLSFESTGSAANLDKNSKEWLSNVLVILDALTDKAKPLIWNLTIPGIEQQNKLTRSLRGDLPVLSYRFRYADVSANGRILSRRSKTIQKDAGKNQFEFARGDVQDADLTFRFYEFTEDSETNAVLSFPGEWSILNLYLTPGVYNDPDSGVLYVPLTVKDRLGAKFVLWVGLKFNKKLPLPQVWPTVRNWIDFSEKQRNIKARRMMSIASWLSFVKKVPEGSAGYEELSRTIQGHDIENYPRLELSFDTPDRDSAEEEALLRYRFAELSVPGRKPVRISTGSSAALRNIGITDPKLEIRLYKHSGDSDAAETVAVNGPYAPLRLLTAPGRRGKDDSLRINYLFTGKNGTKISLPLRLKFVKQE